MENQRKKKVDNGVESGFTATVIPGSVFNFGTAPRRHIELDVGWRVLEFQVQSSSGCSQSWSLVAQETFEKLGSCSKSTWPENGHNVGPLFG